MKGAHAGVLQSIVDSGFKMTDDIHANLTKCAEDFTSAYTPPAEDE